MVVTDLDGTLLHRSGSLGKQDAESLQMLGDRGVLRVIATGRSLYSAYRVLSSETPIDYLVFSSGAGIMEWKSQRIVREHTMEATDVREAAELLLNMDMEFMIHDPIPENHWFHYFGTGHNNPDFIRRLNIYRDFATPAIGAEFTYRRACQIVAVEPDGGLRSAYKDIAKKLKSLTVIRTTSPIDGKSTWIEILPPSVSKSLAAEWLRLEHDIPAQQVLAVGNDYNDLDLLTWAHHRYVVGNAPDELKAQFKSVSTNLENGFSDAVSRWLSRNHHRS
jgi:HAD superfamily hydrolase (TIGR01484 family)